MIMTRLRKLELVTGLATALLAVMASLLMLKIDWDVEQHLERDFATLNEITVALVFFIVPGSIVAIGSYLHVVKRKVWGRFMVGAGSLSLIILFLVSLVALAWSPALWSLLIVLLIVFSIFTGVISFVGKE
jgi:hypothetical protein